MSPNKKLPHVLLLPEDDANRQLARGFYLQVPLSRQRRMQVLPVAGGWTHVMDDFLSDHIVAMDRYPSRFMILLIDFDDQQEERLNYAKAQIPVRLSDRVFILGALNEPEDLKPVFGPYEEIGSKLASDCRENTNDTWGHALLQHNAAELGRLRQHVLPILFPPIGG